MVGPVRLISQGRLTSIGRLLRGDRAESVTEGACPASASASCGGQVLGRWMLTVSHTISHSGAQPSLGVLREHDELPLCGDSSPVWGGLALS